MPAEDEDDAYRRLAASFGDAWAAKGTRIAVALTKAVAAVRAEGSARPEPQMAPAPQEAPDPQETPDFQEAPIDPAIEVPNV